MFRHLIAVASIAAVTGCASHAATTPPSTPKASTEPQAVQSKAAIETPSIDDEVKVEKVATGRKVGDFHVYQYGGSFMKTPVTLTEQVVAKEGDTMIVDFVLEEGSNMSGLRVRMKTNDEIVSVARITATGEEPATVADYDALMAKTQVTPESNDEMLASEHTSCMIGDEAVDCDVTTFRVTLDGKPAKLTVLTSPKTPGRDLGGQIVTDDGKVIYNARMVERGNEPPGIEAFAAMR